MKDKDVDIDEKKHFQKWLSIYYPFEFKIWFGYLNDIKK